MDTRRWNNIRLASATTSNIGKSTLACIDFRYRDQSGQHGYASTGPIPVEDLAGALAKSNLIGTAYLATATAQSSSQGRQQSNQSRQSQAGGQQSNRNRQQQSQSSSKQGGGGGSNRQQRQRQQQPQPAMSRSGLRRVA